MLETGVLFDDIHSFFDLGLVLSHVQIAPAVPKTTYIDIPGGDGSIDLTEANGEVKFYDRTHKFTFTMSPMLDLSERAWEEKKTEISGLLNGRACKVTLDKDPEYYWDGRCKIDSYRSQKRLRQFVISATVRPYKLKRKETTVSFSLTSTGKKIVLHNGRKSVCPVITTTANTTIMFNGTMLNFNRGTHQLEEILLTLGNNHMTVSGSGTITFAYQEGDL